MTIEEVKTKYPPFVGKNGSRFIDESGNQYGQLTVLYRSINCTKDNKAKWICQCSCGKICESTGKELRAGKIISCGCSKVKRLEKLNAVDLIGQRFGKLTVVQRTDQRTSHGRVLWSCKCDCGHEALVSTICLQTGSTKSCGCMNSYGEWLVEEVLKDLGIQYKKQYTFDDLYIQATRKSYLRFDFGVLYNNELQFLIEFDGEQHYTEYESWHVPFDNDNRKNQYCADHELKLLRIKYTDRNYNAIRIIIENFIKENKIQCN